ncbi:MAG: hypothetical protein IKP29_08665 [Pseudobutyrivibrio sp.]|nr:hypothetical protein [Pseudobutyrivibrio sp.]
MGDDNLRKELFYMVRLTSKYDFTKMEVVEEILRLENERQILTSVFGSRFKKRIFDIAAGQPCDNKCVICGQVADNHVICSHCMETISESNYGKKEVAEKQKIAFSKPSLRRVFQYIAIFCLTLILFIQVFVLATWISIPTRNKQQKPKVSKYEPVAVASVEDGLACVQQDFSEEDGYTVYYSQSRDEFVGRFLLDKGDCCLEVEDNLSDEERYDYFFTEEVYVYYISYKDDYTAKQGIAEVNKEGNIIVLGSFNDGRRTDSYYKYR